MVRVLVRLAGLFALAGAVIALVIDGTRSIAASALVVTPLETFWRDAGPSGLDTVKAAFIARLGAGAWNMVAVFLLALPAWFVFGALGALLVFIARPPRSRMAA